MNLNLGPLIGNLHRYPVPIGQTSPETLSFLRPQRSCLRLFLLSHSVQIKVTEATPGGTLKAPNRPGYKHEVELRFISSRRQDAASRR
jgi:hypothetical protein